MSNVIIECDDKLFGHGSLVTIRDVEYIVTYVVRSEEKYRYTLEPYHAWKMKVTFGLL